MSDLEKKHIVCLGGGIGTVNLIHGLREYARRIEVVVSLADEGGSAGRLRRLYGMPPVGDLASCIAAMAKDDKTASLLRFRFPGDRYGKDELLGGHKLGNLLLAAAYLETKSLSKAISQVQELVSAEGIFLTATQDAVSIEADTEDGRHVIGEEKIDLGKYAGDRVLSHISLMPKNPPAPEETIEAIRKADVIIAGPGDLYTPILPVLIVPEIMQAVKESTAKKIFIVNVANKPFETKGYNVSDFVDAVTKHLNSFPFSLVLANNNTSFPIPKPYHYSYVPISEINGARLVVADLIDEQFPLYHSQKKLASCLVKEL